MRRSRIVVLIAVCFVFATVSFGQTFKLDEFRQVDDAELKARVDTIFTHLNHSDEVRACVIVYAPVDQYGADGEQTELLLRIRRFVGASQHHEKRTTTIFGGYRKTESAEIYIMLKGGPLPQPTWTIADSGGNKDALLWSTRRFREEDDELNEFVNRALLYRLAEKEDLGDTDGSEPAETNEYNGPAYTVPNDSFPIATETETETETITDTALEPEIKSPSAEVESQIEEETPDLTAEEMEEIRFSSIERDFAEAVKKRDGSHGVMIVYADDQFYDISRLQTFIEQGRDRIAAKAELDPALIEVTFGGYRGQAQIEYYIVPEGGKEPEAKPEER